MKQVASYVVQRLRQPIRLGRPASYPIHFPWTRLRWFGFLQQLCRKTVADDSCHYCNQSHLQPYNSTVHSSFLSIYSLQLDSWIIYETVEDQNWWRNVCRSSYYHAIWKLKLKLESSSRFVPSVSPSLLCGLHTARAPYCSWMIMQLNPTLKMWAQVCNPTLKIWTQVCNEHWKSEFSYSTQHWKLSKLRFATRHWKSELRFANQTLEIWGQALKLNTGNYVSFLSNTNTRWWTLMMKKQWEFIAAMIIKPQASSSSSSSSKTRLINLLATT